MALAWHKPLSSHMIFSKVSLRSDTQSSASIYSSYKDNIWGPKEYIDGSGRKGKMQRNGKGEAYVLYVSQNLSEYW